MLFTVKDPRPEHIAAEIVLSIRFEQLFQFFQRMFLARVTSMTDSDESGLANCQRLITIADHSKLGWKVIAEYEVDELVSDSEDKKKLEKAERSTERMATKKRKAAVRHNSGIFNKPRQTPAGSFEPTPWFHSAGYQPLQSTPRRSQIPAPKPPPSVGSCFSCGEMDHLKRFCPRSGPGAARWYPDDAATESMSKNTKGSVTCVRCSSIEGSLSHVRDTTSVNESVDSLTDSGLSTAGHRFLKGDVRVGINWVNVGAFPSQSSGNASEDCIRLVLDWEHEANDNAVSSVNGSWQNM